MEIFFIISSLIVLIFSAILHEIAHGATADRLGDPTARISGRLTLNPIPHIDPMMSILLPLVLIISGSPVIFGGAKPVPVDPYNLKEGRKDLALVSLAGPLTNIILAVVASIILHVFFPDTAYVDFFNLSRLDIVAGILVNIVSINLLLAIFNLLPIPPLDGSKIFSLVLPEKNAKVYQSIGEFGTFILFFLLFFPIGPFSLQSILGYLHQLTSSLLGF